MCWWNLIFSGTLWLLVILTQNPTNCHLVLNQQFHVSRHFLVVSLALCYTVVLPRCGLPRLPRCGYPVLPPVKWTFVPTASKDSQKTWVRRSTSPGVTRGTHNGKQRGNTTLCFPFCQPGTQLGTHCVCPRGFGARRSSHRCETRNGKIMLCKVWETLKTSRKRYRR